MRRLLERLGERDDLDAGSLEPGDVGKIGPKLALDHDQAIGGKRGDARAERFLDSVARSATPVARIGG